MNILNITNSIRAMAIIGAFAAALACYGCIDVSSSTAPSEKTTCTTGADGTQTCTTQPTGGSHWGFFL